VGECVGNDNDFVNLLREYTRVSSVILYCLYINLPPPEIACTRTNTQLPVRRGGTACPLQLPTGAQLIKLSLARVGQEGDQEQSSTV
jgi:hypothetical protein